jgi:hypothetical protein
MGRIFTRRVPGDEANVYSCGECSSHVATADEIVSRSFHGRGGRAYLIGGVVNVYKGTVPAVLWVWHYAVLTCRLICRARCVLSAGPPEVRVLMTGLHTVADIFCVRCHALLGWAYIEAVQESEKVRRYGVCVCVCVCVFF